MKWMQSTLLWAVLTVTLVAQPALTPEKIAELKARFDQGKDLVAKAQFRDAIKIFGGILQEVPNAKGSLLMSGICYNELFEFDKAAPLFDRFLKVEPTNPPGIIGAIKAHQVIGNLDRVNQLRKQLYDIRQKGGDEQLGLQDSYERERIKLQGVGFISVVEFFEGNVGKKLYGYRIFGKQGLVRTLDWKVAPNDVRENLVKEKPELKNKTLFILGEPLLRNGVLVDYKIHEIALARPNYEQAKSYFMQTMQFVSAGKGQAPGKGKTP